MRVGIIGAGNVGGTLGRRLAQLGHDVTFGLRDPTEGAAGVKGGKDLPKSARTASVSGAAHDVDAVILATPWAAVPDAISQAGSLAGVILVDATNPLSAGLALDVGPAGESASRRRCFTLATRPARRLLSANGCRRWASIPSTQGLCSALVSWSTWHSSGFRSPPAEWGARLRFASCDASPAQALLAMPLKTYMFRPGAIIPLHGIRSRTG